MRVLVLALAALSLQAGELKLTEEMWTDIRPIYAKTLAHPFLKGLTDGTLPRAHFRFYLMQDAKYLRVFGQALGVLASKAPRQDWAITLNQHSLGSVKEVDTLHAIILRAYGVPLEQSRDIAMAPVNYAYTNHIMATALGKPFAYGLAAVLPCYWIYLEVGKELIKKGSKDTEYQKWIDSYASDAYAKEVADVLDMMNAEAAKLDPESRHDVRELFKTSARYEWMFWDMAWREEKWLP
jgi:thiaminase/transcriptional activator TenA